MDQQNTDLKNNIIRADKNLGSDSSLEWLDTFESDASLCLDIILYISHSTQKDIFNFGKIDLDHFARVMGHGKENLQRLAKANKLEQKSKKKNFYKTLERHEKYITVFENALYKLGTNNITLDTFEYDVNDNEYKKVSKFIQIITDLEIHNHSHKNKTKIYYTYTTSKEFDYNLSRNFFLIDLTVVKDLRKKGLLNLYLYLKNLENCKHYHFTESDFGKLCHFAGIDFSNESVSIRYAKKNLLNRKLKPLKDFINFDFDPVNISGKWKYGFSFMFNNNKEKDKNLDVLNIKQADADYINVQLVKFYKRKYKIAGSIDETLYKKWFFDESLDLEKKHDIYLSAVSKLNKMSKDETTRKFFYLAKNFFSGKS